jgi:hypothetical protein
LVIWLLIKALFGAFLSITFFGDLFPPTDLKVNLGIAVTLTAGSHLPVLLARQGSCIDVVQSV